MKALVTNDLNILVPATKIKEGQPRGCSFALWNSMARKVRLSHKATKTRISTPVCKSTLVNRNKEKTLRIRFTHRIISLK